MHSKRQPRMPLRTVFGLCAAIALSCRPDYEDGYMPVEAGLPPGTESTNAQINVRVPEGEWSFQVSARGFIELRSAQPAPVLSSKPPDAWCQTGTCHTKRFDLTCPEGFCSYSFDVAVDRGENRDVALSAGMVFLDLEQGVGGESEGCSRKKSPNYVPWEERERLFEVTLVPYDTVVVPLDDGGTSTDVLDSLDGGQTTLPALR